MSTRIVNIQTTTGRTTNNLSLKIHNKLKENDKTNSKSLKTNKLQLWP